MCHGRPTSIRTLLIINLILLSVTILVALAHRRQTFSSATANVEEQLGMDLAYSQGPIALFTDDKGASGTRLKLFDTSQDLLLSLEESKSNKQESTVRVVVVSLGTDFEMRFDASIGLAGPRVREIMATIEDAIYVDLNADGVYDTRILSPIADSADGLSLTQVRYENQWLGARRERGLNLRKRSLLDGRTVQFEQTRGEWIVQ